MALDNIFLHPFRMSVGCFHFAIADVKLVGTFGHVDIASAQLAMMKGRKGQKVGK